MIKWPSCHSLSTQVAQHMLVQLDGESLLRIAGASRWWRDVSESEHVWHTLCVRLNIATSRADAAWIRAHHLGRLNGIVGCTLCARARRLSVKGGVHVPSMHSHELVQTTNSLAHSWTRWVVQQLITGKLMQMKHESNTLLMNIL
jgi:hypothetical protein